MSSRVLELNEKLLGLLSESIPSASRVTVLGSPTARPLIVVFEDLHWIDAATQALLDTLVESLPTARVLLLVNYRPEYQHA